MRSRRLRLRSDQVAQPLMLDVRGEDAGERGIGNEVRLMSDIEERIRERAYQIWLEEGCPEGR